MEETAVMEVVKYKSVVPSIQEYWLKTVPDAEDYIDVLVRCFANGLD